MEINIPHGYKTYIVAVAGVAYALGGMVAGYIPITEGIAIILGALGLSGLRHGIQNFLTPEEPPAQTPPQ